MTEWNDDKTRFRAFACRHQEDHGLEDNLAIAKKYLSEDYIEEALEDDKTFFHCAFAYLIGTEIHGDQWFAVIYERSDGKTCYIQCDDVMDGLAMAIRFQNGDFDEEEEE